MLQKRKHKDLYESLKLIRQAQIKKGKVLLDKEIQNLPTLEERLAAVLQIEKEHQKKCNNMLFFVMYDIENNKIRNEIAKFLKKQGCVRVQKSIFFASATLDTYTYIHSVLKQVQEMYDNNDSIFVVPISADYIRAMKIIGKSIDFDIITGNKNTLFF